MNNRTLYKKIGKLNNNIPHNNIITGRNGIMMDVIIFVIGTWNVVVVMIGYSRASVSYVTMKQLLSYVPKKVE